MVILQQETNGLDTNITTDQIPMKKIWIYNINGGNLNLANSYSQNADFNVNRITVQGTTAWVNGNNIVEIKFKVKDNFGTNFSDYSNVVALNWANVKSPVEHNYK